MCFGAGFGMRTYINDRLIRVRVFGVSRLDVSQNLKEDNGGRQSLAEKQHASLHRMTHRASTGNREFVSHCYLQNTKVLSTLIIALDSSESYTKHNRIIDLDD